MNRQGGPPPPVQKPSDRDWDTPREPNRDARDRERGYNEPDRAPTVPIRKSFSHERWGGRGAAREDGELAPEGGPAFRARRLPWTSTVPLFPSLLEAEASRRTAAGTAIAGTRRATLRTPRRRSAAV